MQSRGVNGSTTDFGSVSLGSNPGGTANLGISMELPIHLKFHLLFSVEHRGLGEELVAILRLADKCTMPDGLGTGLKIKSDDSTNDNITRVFYRFESAVLTVEEWYRIQRLQYFLQSLASIYVYDNGLKVHDIEVSQLYAEEDSMYQAYNSFNIFKPGPLFPEASDTDVAVRLTTDGDPKAILKFNEVLERFDCAFTPMRKRYEGIPEKTVGERPVKQYYKYVSDPTDTTVNLSFAYEIAKVLGGVTLKSDISFKEMVKTMSDRYGVEIKYE